MNKWRSSNGGVLTHTLMDGGSLSVPRCDSGEFFKTIIDTLRAGRRLYVVELKTPKFKMFMDVDYVGETTLSRDEIISIVHKIHHVIPGKCVVAIAKPKKKDHLIKSGIHIHWPDLAVTKSKAIDLMNEVLGANMDEPFAKFIDDSVYKGSGLRMLWCHKKGKCGDEDPYEPFYDASAQTFFTNTSVPKIPLLKLFSIRIESSVDEECRPLDVSCDTIEGFVETCARNERALKGLRNLAEPPIRITKMARKNNYVFVQTQSKFCMNKKECHKSNHIYFVIDTDAREMFQRCFDDECKKYEGVHHRVPREILEKVQDEVPREVLTFADFYGAFDIKG